MKKNKYTKAHLLSQRVNIESSLVSLFEKQAKKEINLNDLESSVHVLMAEGGQSTILDYLVKRLEGASADDQKTIIWLLVNLKKNPNVVFYLRRQVKRQDGFSDRVRMMLSAVLKEMGEEVGIKEPLQKVEPVANEPLNPLLAIIQESVSNVTSDYYLEWICRMIGGWLSPNDGNIMAFDFAVRHMPRAGAIIEIGSFLGMSTNIIAYLAIKYQRDNPFYSCDPWAFENAEKPIGGYFDASSDVFRNYAKETFKHNIEVFSGTRKPHTIEAFSDRFFELWQHGSVGEDVFGRSVTFGGPISFAYIDGAHTYQAAKADFLGVDQNLLPGGFVLFDDSADGTTWEVNQLVHEIEQNPSYQLVFKTPNYFFQKRIA